MDARIFTPADAVDPEYGRRLRQALKDGVEIMACDTLLNLRHIALHRFLPWRL